MNTEPTLYERMGGDEKVTQMLHAFYEKVLTDSELAPFFAQTDIQKLVKMQHEFFSIALGGPVEYPSRRLIAAHHGRGISRKHFTKFCHHLLDTLVDHGLSSKDADQVLIRIGMYAGNITGDVGVDG